MRQLVELNENAAKFEEMGVEVIAVFREEAEGVAGLQKIKDRTSVEFTLCLDTGAKQTAKYSPVKREFDNYVIDKTGKIAAKIDGTLRKRARSEQILEILTELAENEESDDDN
jgi:peroxiredoxin